MNESMGIEELREKAREAGIDSWHVKSKARLIDELKAIYAEAEETDAKIEAATVLPEPTNPRVQMQRGTARIGVMREQVYEHLRDGWIEIDAE